MKTPLLVLALFGSSIAATSLVAEPEDRPAPPDPETVVIDLFEFDADGNNSLSQDELLTGFQELRNKHRGARPEGRKGGPRMGRQGGEGDGELKGPPPGGKGKKGKKGKKGGRRGPPSPEEMGSRMIENFDASGDGELNPEELLEAVSAMHERRGPGRRGPAPEETSE
ncbi:EF-hand domain-containing protein [Pelagicoccus mobilis]|uniref:EF-hand domain-containing protein n=1 Tax=Pelagicoccus mobilis TaxID=415221 RepID=A0A934RW26_9BACT|nr:EF-hand domain-containing protein [Pelagicoccus mobilis]MBK1876525.1 hypothetical protein [Pelagicoccus mobilis]